MRSSQTRSTRREVHGVHQLRRSPPCGPRPSSSLVGGADRDPHLAVLALGSPGRGSPPGSGRRRRAGPGFRRGSPPGSAPGRRGSAGPPCAAPARSRPRVAGVEAGRRMPPRVKEKTSETSWAVRPRRAALARSMVDLDLAPAAGAGARRRPPRRRRGQPPLGLLGEVRSSAAVLAEELHRERGAAALVGILLRRRPGPRGSPAAPRGLLPAAPARLVVVRSVRARVMVVAASFSVK
jgi:hypothetical protein